MAGKPLNKKNLAALGADALADLLLDAVKGDAARQRRVRMALSTEQGPREAAADIRKRFAQIRKARSFLSWKTQRALARELTDLIDMIDQRIAQEDAQTGFDLLWALLHLAPAIHARTDDSNGTIGGVMDAAMEAIARLAPRLDMDAQRLADTVLDAIMEDGYGAFDNAVTALGEALGETGLGHLKAAAEAVLSAPLTEVDLAHYAFVRDAQRRADLARDNRDRTAKIILQDVADLQGDVDAWLAGYTDEQLSFHTIAPQAAQRLCAAGRPKDALRIVQTCLANQEAGDQWFDTPGLDDAHFACLEALGKEEALRAALWTRFKTRLCAPTLRRYIARLPDFEDEEALMAAQAGVLVFPDVVTALGFCLTWPDPALAAKLVLSRADEVEGDAYEILTPAAEMLAPEHPRAAVLVWRAMILFALEKARSGRYGHAARHLASCAQADTAIVDYGGHPDHAAFVDALRKTHGRKSAFWSRIA